MSLNLTRASLLNLFGKAAYFKNRLFSMAVQRQTTLVAFDFDHTVVESNTDVEVQKLAPGGVLPQEIKDTFSSHGWTKFMGNIFKYLHKNGVTKTEIFNLMGNISFTSGIKELLSYCTETGYEIIIISDSNSAFINHILDVHDLASSVFKVYTNPAEFNGEGLLEIDFYHTQDWCDISTVNLCKGHILETHIKERKEDNVVFDRVVYVGDGGNDLCPCLRLSESDLACARNGFALIKKLNKMMESDNMDSLKAPVLSWDTGLDILKALKEPSIGSKV